MTRTPGREDLSDGEKHGDGKHALARAKDARPEEAPDDAVPGECEAGMTRTMRTTGRCPAHRRTAAEAARDAANPLEPSTIVDAVRLAREEGHAMAFEETLSGVNTVSVPIEGPAGRVSPPARHDDAR